MKGRGVTYRSPLFGKNAALRNKSASITLHATTAFNGVNFTAIKKLKIDMGQERGYMAKCLLGARGMMRSPLRIGHSACLSNSSGFLLCRMEGTGEGKVGRAILEEYQKA